MYTCSHTQSAITEHLDITREYLEQMKREQRIKEREAVKQVGDSLKSLCEGGGTLGEIQNRREEFAKELKQMREEFQVWYCKLALACLFIVTLCIGSQFYMHRTGHSNVCVPIKTF